MKEYSPYEKRFFSLAEIKQPVNQWICITFLAVLCFWVVLYYAVEKANDIGKSFAELTPQEFLQ